MFEVFFGEHVVEDMLSDVGHVPFFELAPVYVEESLLEVVDPDEFVQVVVDSIESVFLSSN